MDTTNFLSSGASWENGSARYGNGLLV